MHYVIVSLYATLRQRSQLNGLGRISASSPSASGWACSGTSCSTGASFELSLYKQYNAWILHTKTTSADPKETRTRIPGRAGAGSPQRWQDEVDSLPEDQNTSTPVNYTQVELL
jgi:hypothetical protein